MSTASGDTAAVKPAKAVRLARSKQRRSRVTNGRDLLPGTNGNTQIGRRYRDIAAQIAIDLGGPETLSEAHAQLVRRYAAVCCQLEVMEAALVEGQPYDFDHYCKLISAQSRIAMRLKLKRVAKDVTPPKRRTLRDYAAEYGQREAAPAAGPGEAAGDA